MTTKGSVTHNKLKIAIDCLAFQSGIVGGLESYLINLLNGFKSNVSNNVAITLFILENQATYFECFQNQFNIKQIKSKKVYGRIFWQNIILPLYSFNYDVFLFTSNFRPLFLFCNSVTVIHDLQYIYFPEYWDFNHLLYRRIFIPLTIKNSSKIIAISNSVANEIKSNFGDADVEVIWNPICIKNNKEFNGKNCCLDVGTDYFLVPSSLSPHKNLYNLLEAIENLSSEISRFKFVFIGPYKIKDFHARFKVSADSVIILGYVDKDTRDFLYRNCKAIVYPSIYEGFGMPFAEAILSEKPIICSDIPVAREILNDFAIYIDPPYGSEQIHNALIKFSKNDFKIPTLSYIDKIRYETNPNYVAEKYLKVLTEIAR